MPTWVQPAAGYLAGVWTADMGEFIGDWPLLPGGVLDDVDEVDFYVMLPNPAAPTDLDQLADGTYDTPLWFTFRTDLTTGYDYGGDPSYATGGVLPPTPPAGVHLYVVGYATGGVVPPNPPEFYVPPEYSADGAAAFKTAMGTWVHEDGFDVDELVSYDGTVSQDFTSATLPDPTLEETYPSDESIPAKAAIAFGHALAAAARVVQVTAGSYLSIAAGKGRTSLIVVETDVRVEFTQEIIRFTADLSLPTPEEPVGVEFTPTPFITPDGSPGAPYEYDDPDLASWEWDAWSVDVESLLTTVDAPVAPSANWSIGWMAWADVPSSGAVSGASTLDAGSVTGATGTDSRAVDLSAVAEPDLAIIFGPDVVETGSWDSAISPDLTMPPALLTVSDYSFDLRFFPTTELMLHKTTPGWQYWAPGGVVPSSGAVKWHTVGGHAGTVGGATLQIKTPGVGWVDWVDGPA